ncbi:MAG TPA: nickel-binding protein [Candidatus Binatia bacterium]|nr:nickel-binding protein [Candidatus Binatia bacterium]
MAYFLVERFVPSLASQDVGAAVARLDEGGGDRPARHLWTALIATEETCLSLFEAPDPEAVAEINRVAGFDFDRVVEASVFGPSSHADQ